MLGLEKVWEPRNRTPVLIVSAGILLAIAWVDWWIQPYISLGFLYLFPIMLAAGFLPRWGLALLGASCAVLVELFSPLEVSDVRLCFEALALAGCGLFVRELIASRRMNLEAQQRLQALVETSPAAIITVNAQGFIDLANRAAMELAAPREGRLVGTPIAAILPDLHHALRREDILQFRASMQCRGLRGTGEVFMADVWFSTYREAGNPKLAAIIGEIAEETPTPANPPSLPARNPMTLTPREAEVLRLVVRGLSNKQIAAALEISESAVKNNLQQLFAKSGVRRRGQLVRVALEEHQNPLPSGSNRKINLP